MIFFRDRLVCGRETSGLDRLFLLFLFLFVCASSVWPARRLLWVLDAGHGGSDVGCESSKYYEKDITLDITKKVQALLNKNNPEIKVMLTRSKDRFVSLSRRCEIANGAGADLFLSIHVNALERNRLMRGTETFFASTSFLTDAVLLSSQNRNVGKSELLAWMLQKNYRDVGRPSERGAKPENLYVCTHTMMPAALTEVGFITNTKDLAYITSERGKNEIARCIYQALMDYRQATQNQKNNYKKILLSLRYSNGKYSGMKNEKRKIVEPEPAMEPLVAKNRKGVGELGVPPEDPLEEELPSPVDSISAEGTCAEETAATEAEKAVVDVPQVPTFSIQILSCDAELKPKDARLKGLTPVKFVKSGKVYKGLYGETTSYKQARTTLKQVREKFPDAFLVSYLGKEPIPTSQALEMIKGKF